VAGTGMPSAAAGILNDLPPEKGIGIAFVVQDTHHDQQIRLHQ
jgi:hypothetical protein